MPEGYIKFKCNFQKKDCISYEDISDILKIRNKLFQQKLIGCDSDNIGYGNISKRLSSNSFIITGTKTSCKEKINEKDFSKVIGWDIQKNIIICQGLIQASSESLTHAAIYEVQTKAKYIIHIHNSKLWTKYIDNLPTSDKSAEYGTPEIALSIKKIVSNDESSKVIIMGGHPDGIIVWDETIEKAYNTLISI